MAKLIFRYGVMGSSKSTNLLEVAHNYNQAGKNVLIMKPQIDTKGDKNIVSRLGVSRLVDFIIKPTTEIGNKVIDFMGSKKIHCVLIDEIQFLEVEQIDQLFHIAKDLNIPVICYGLRTDYMQRGFKASERLLLLADSIEELKTICCNCGNHKATMHMMAKNGEMQLEGSQINIDNSDEIEYFSVCGDCLLSFKHTLNTKEHLEELDKKFMKHLEEL